MRAGDSAESSPHIALYIITRSNRRIYAYLEIVEIGGAETRIDVVSVNSLLETLQDQGFIIIPDIEFQDDLALTADSDLAATVSLLQADPSTRVYLVAHLNDAGDIDALMQRSQQRANVLRQLLIGRGIDANRIVSRGVGPLAPNCGITSCANRVELVLQ